MALLWVTLSLLLVGTTSAIPEPWQTAKMARYIINQVDWVSIATISTLNDVKGYPFVNVKSMCDGPRGSGSGNPYLLMNDMDLSGKDVLVDNRVTILATLAEVDYCKSQSWDPQDPRCGRLIITGKLNTVGNTTTEYAYAQKALFNRHPSMKMWVKVHSFYIAKVNIEEILVLDYFGGAKQVKIDDYFKAKLDHEETKYVYKREDIIIEIV